MKLWADIPYVTSPNLLYYLMMMNSKAIVYSRRYIKHWQLNLASVHHILEILNRIIGFNYI